ncbi:1,4-alpha-glucan branching protein GlgB [Pontibacter pudoricolor]|uniref:1,4-alpha-glucan branching protein GlgB n=1 Tax=Pontibacter pudoricolor TaxID=2694930 RepID=UPI001391EBF2|nr:1,4-alpha-glucan branching protein GlgB [Pontibacter pudoricolor]
MAKRKQEKAPETNLTTPLTDAGSAASPKRGRPRKADLAAEMGSPVTEAPVPEGIPTVEKPKRIRTKAIPVETTDLTPAPKVRAAKKAAGTTTIASSQTIVPQEKRAVYYDISRFTEFDVYLFKEGRHFTLYDKMGAHCMEHAGLKGTYFAVWAPNAEHVTVIGDFNHWNRDSHSLKVREDGSGIWEGFIPDLTGGELYKYHIKSNYNLYHVEKSDPFAFAREKPPQTASRICDLKYEWKDNEWMERRKTIAGQAQPMSVYEVHLGSWRRRPEDNNRPLTYHELAEELPQYVKEMGFTHVEFMPVMHHPFMGSWGYQVTGYFAAASVYGSPQELMHLIDVLHQHGIGVILDWVPSHFPSDEHGLAYFDGTHLYEHADPRKGYHPDWKSYIFNYGRNEVRSFLISNALFWLDKYHVDGLRVDAVASMLYLDYSRKEGEWIPNEHGGRENLEAISLIKDFNQAVHEKYPDVQTIAEESTAWPAVTGKVNDGGLGFDMKWMMGWMHDTLDYFSKDPIYRKHHQGEITFSIIYAFSERFMLPLSHDEVVHGKGSLIRKMPGDEWQQFANLRSLYSYMYAHPGTKLLFMGGELAQSTEWNHDSSLDWHLLQYNYHSGVQRMLQQLNKLYQQEPALYELSFDSSGFEWIDFQDAHNSVISFLRKGKDPKENIFIVCNFTPIVHEHYRLGVPHGGEWIQIFNSDDEQYGGSNVQNQGSLQATQEPSHGRDYSLTLKLPPLAVVYFKLKG